MPETRLDNVRHALVGALERIAGRDDSARRMVDMLEDDLKSLSTLMHRLSPDQLRLADVQDVVAHLLDHVIGECWEPAEGNQELSEALDDYVDLLASRLEAKMPMNSRHSDALENVFSNYWEDNSGDDEGEGEDEDAEAGREEEAVSGRVLREIDPKTATIPQLRAWYKETVGYDPQEPPENLSDRGLRQLVAEHLEEFKDELPARRPAQPLRPRARPRPRPAARFPKSAELSGDIEIGEE